VGSAHPVWGYRGEAGSTPRSVMRAQRHRGTRPRRRKQWHFFIRLRRSVGSSFRLRSLSKPKGGTKPCGCTMIFSRSMALRRQITNNIKLPRYGQSVKGPLTPKTRLPLPAYRLHRRRLSPCQISRNYGHNHCARNEIERHDESPRISLKC